jgi:endonuclease I
LKFAKSYKIIGVALCLILGISLLTAQIPAGYYDSAAGKTGAELKAALYNIIKGHTEYPYTSSSTDVWDILKETDRDPNNPENVILLYTGWSMNGAAEYDNEKGWCREHVWAKSHGNFDEVPPAGTDVHHLRPADITVNSARSNKDFDNGGTRYIDGDGATDCYTDSDSWEPRDAVKGDVARMMFYMCTRYEGENGEPELELVDQVNTYSLCSDGIGYFGKLSTLMQWHDDDPVDNFERNRNEVIYSYQHNRNPFIDHPEYVELIWGSDLPPLAPSNLSAGTITQTSVILTWSDNSLDETGFRIYQDDDSLTTTAANVTTYTVENLTPATHYVFTVIAFNQNGESGGANLEIVTRSESTAADSVFFSEYIEGRSYNKALEIVNAANSAVVLSDYAILSNYNNNNGSWNTTHYNFPSGTILEFGEVWVIANSSADQKIKTVADDTLTSTSAGGVVNFNGNDVRALVKITEGDTAIIDVIGLSNDPDLGDGWSIAGISQATKDHTLIRKPGIKKGNPDWISSAGTNAEDSEWLVCEIDTFDSLGTHRLEPAAQDEIRVALAKPATYRLYANYPNPFNLSTTIRYDLRQATTITLTVYDLKGSVVDDLVHEHQPAGTYYILWNSCNAVNRPVAGGIYLYRLQTADGFTQTGKMILLK